MEARGRCQHLPEGILVWNPSQALGDVISHGLYGVVFAFLIVTLFDTTGTMIGVAKAGWSYERQYVATCTPRSCLPILSRYSRMLCLEQALHLLILNRLLVLLLVDVRA